MSCAEAKATGCFYDGKCNAQILRGEVSEDEKREGLKEYSRMQGQERSYDSLV